MPLRHMECLNSVAEQGVKTVVQSQALWTPLSQLNATDLADLSYTCKHFLIYTCTLLSKGIPPILQLQWPARCFLAVVKNMQLR